MNDSSGQFEPDFSKPPRSGGKRSNRAGMQYDNLDKARLDQNIPKSALLQQQSSRSNKNVRFENNKMRQNPKPTVPDDRDFIDQDDSRPNIRKKIKQKVQDSELDSVDQQYNRRLKGSNNLHDLQERFHPMQQNRQIEDQYDNAPSSKRSTLSKAFEPQYMSSRQVLAWQAKPTKEGFLYFYIPGTNTFQWQFPTFFDTKSGKKKHCFLEKWQAKVDNTGKQYYVNPTTKQSQDVKPDSETYILQAAMVGNIAFVELYISVQGDLGIEDQRGRNSLHQSVSNGHHQLTQMLCEFGGNDNLIERTDKYGCTPLFNAVRYNQTDCLQVLLQYNCNLFHRNKKGDTCLHYAAQYNAEECIIILGSFCGLQLLQTRNKEGLKPIEVAEAIRNFSCLNTLQVIERNILYQNALIFKENGGKQKPISARNDPRQLSNRTQDYEQAVVPKRNPNVKVFEEDNSQDSEEDADRPSHLDYSDHYQKAYSQRNKDQRVLDHEREYRQKTMRDNQLTKAVDKRTPRFVPKRGVPQKNNLQKNSGRQDDQDSQFDDELNDRVSVAARERSRQDRYQIYPKENEDDKPTVFEKAYDGLSKFGSFFKTMTTKVVDYVYSETPRISSRSRNRVLPNNELDVIHNRSRSRSQSAGQRRRPQIQLEETLNSELEYQQNLGQDSSGSSNYKTTYDRSQSRPATAPRSRSRPLLVQDEESLQQVQPLPIHTQRVVSLKEPIQSSIKFDNQRYPQTRQVSPPPKKMVSKQTEVSQDHSVEMRSICIQAMPPKRVKRKRKIDVSKHSIGVGSQRIDETTMPLQNQSETNIEPESSNSKIAVNRMKKLKQIKLGNLNKNLIQKRYQSEEEDRKREEDSKNYSPSPQPKFMKPEVVIIRRADLMDPTAKKQEIPANFFHPSPPPAVSVSVNQLMPEQQNTQQIQSIQEIQQVVVQSTGSKTKAPSILTKNQVDILNLNGQVASQSNSNYQLETDIQAQPPPIVIFQQSVASPVNQITSKAQNQLKPTSTAKEFYAKLVNDISQESDELTLPFQQQPVIPKKVIIAELKPEYEVIEFNPEEQDEENYEFHNENLQFYNKCNSDESLVADLNEERLTQMSDPSFIPGKQSLKFGQNMTAHSLDRCHLQQSNTSQHHHSITNINSRSILKPLKMLQGYPQSDCEGGPTKQHKIIMPLLPKRQEQTLKRQQQSIDLFSEESEKARLHMTATIPKAKPTPNPVDDSYVFQGIESPDQSMNQKHEKISEPVQPVLIMSVTNIPKSLGSQDKNSSNKGGRYDLNQNKSEDEIIHFDITQEITQQQDITQNVQIEEAKNQFDVIQNQITETSLMQSHRQQQSSVITPDTSTVPTQETPRYMPQEPQTNKIQQDLKLVTEVHTTELLDPQQIMLEEVDTISMLYDGLQEETVVNVEETKSVTPAETPNRNTNTLGYASSGPEDEGFQFHQNRSTAVFNQRRNTFMSSDDERGDPSSRRKTAANKQMHVSSLMGETKQNDKLKNRKSVKEIGFRRGQKQDDSQLDAMSQGQGSDTTPKAQMSVADRLKSSLASFKNNKLSMDKDKNKSVLSRASNENKSMAQKRATTPVQDRKPVK